MSCVAHEYFLLIDGYNNYELVTVFASQYFLLSMQECRH